MKGGTAVNRGAELFQNMEHRCPIRLYAALECAEYADVTGDAAHVYASDTEPVHQIINMSSGGQVSEYGIFLYVFLIPFLEYLDFSGRPVQRLDHRRVDT